jgi:Protein of unknown function (DUF3024)
LVESTMTLSEFEIRRCEKLVAEFVEERRPPPHIRAQVDLAFRISGQSIEIFEVRPHWRNKGKMLEHAVAKATYNKSKLVWKVFWQRADLKWHSYQPSPEVASVEEFLGLVRNDDHCCFFG